MKPVLLGRPLASLLEPDSLSFGGVAEPRRMIVRLGGDSPRRIAALLEESAEGDWLTVTDLVHDVVLGEFERASGLSAGGCTYVEQVDRETRTLVVSWAEGTAELFAEVVRPSFVA